jgi:excisionase family DNA binding protein
MILGKQDMSCSLYQVQRHVFLPDIKKPLREYRKIILIEEDLLPFTPEKAQEIIDLRKNGSTEWPGVPKEVFKKYWSLRVEMAMEAKEQLDEIFEKVLGELPEDDWISISEAAKIWGCSRHTIRRAIEKGIIKKWKRLPSGYTYVSRKEIKSLVQTPLDALPSQAK